MKKNLPVRAVVLVTVWSLAACGSDTTAKSITASRNDSATTIKSPEVVSTTETTETVETTETLESVETLETVDGFTFTPPAGDYSVVFPSEPTTNEQTVPLEDGSSLPITFYLTDSDRMELGTAAIVYPPGSVLSLEGARDGAISNISGTLTSSDPIKLQGREGLQFTATVQDGKGTYLSRVYYDDVNLYQVIAVVLGEASFDDPEIVAFFDSFHFTVDI
jgi:hypothetical protein